jgi:hypothetical protein
MSGVRMTNVQIPNPNEVPMTKSQCRATTVISGFRNWSLEIGHWDFIGIWDLDIGISAIGISTIGISTKALR